MMYRHLACNIQIDMKNMVAIIYDTTGRHLRQIKDDDTNGYYFMWNNDKIYLYMLENTDIADLYALTEELKEIEAKYFHKLTHDFDNNIREMIKTTEEILKNDNINTIKDENQSKKYAVTIVETLRKTVIVEGVKNIDEAVELAENENIILSPIDDSSDRAIIPSEYWDGGEVPETADVSYYTIIRK